MRKLTKVLALTLASSMALSLGSLRRFLFFQRRYGRFRQHGGKFRHFFRRHSGWCRRRGLCG